MKHLTRCVDALLKDEAYNLYNLGSRNYTPDTIEHWLRYHYPVLLSAYEAGPSSDFESELLDIYLDLTDAISSLSSEEQEAVQFLTEGWPLYGKDNAASKLGVDDRTLRKRLRSAYRDISLYLNSPKEKED